MNQGLDPTTPLVPRYESGLILILLKFISLFDLLKNFFLTVAIAQVNQGKLEVKHSFSCLEIDVQHKGW